ncbi:zinc finger, CCHC-type, retrotransposon gag domain protein, partial [Tanacetum coccineum]
ILDGIVNTEFTDVSQVANAARNMEILRERSSQNNKRNHNGDHIRPTTQDSNQMGYDQNGYDGHSQKRYPDYASSPLCVICGKLHPSKACHRVTGACFTCGSTGHMDRDCPKNGGNGGRGDENDNQPVTRACLTCGLTRHMARDCPKNGGNGVRGDDNDNHPATKGRVFSSTKDQVANSSSTVLGTLFWNGRAVLSYLIRVQHIL